LGDKLAFKASLRKEKSDSRRQAHILSVDDRKYWLLVHANIERVVDVAPEIDVLRWKRFNSILRGYIVLCEWPEVKASAGLFSYHY